MDLRPLLQDIGGLRDLSRLILAWGHEPLWEPVPPPAGRRSSSHQTYPVVVGRCDGFAWLALSDPSPERAVRGLARRWASRGRVCGVLGLSPAGDRLAVSIALDGAPVTSLDPRDPDPVALGCLARLAGGADNALAYAARAAEALAGESAGRRFFAQFRVTLERMAAGLPGPMRADDRRAYALLQLTRVLFLYFIAVKGWLAGRERFLAERVDACLLRRRRIHRDLLKPLFFGTLNRPAEHRTRLAAGFGSIPFLNGGLFEPHPIERRAKGDIPNDIWRDAFDGLFERFHFTLAEGTGDGRIAPDMLGRVFEGVMAPDHRRVTGTYYTPARLVHRVLEAALAAHLARRLGCSEAEAERRLGDPDSGAARALETVTLLDPAVGSGAFLLGALERLAGPSSAKRRAVLQRNLYGVDRSAAAVRLTELRLWLAVIANDRATRPERVRPLPNLDCLIRQGDSLFEPVGDGLRLAPVSRPLARELAQARRQVVIACGPDKAARVRRLAALEGRATEASLVSAESTLGDLIRELLDEARTPDLFGCRRGLGREQRVRLRELRRELREARRARRTVAREREVPWFHYRCHFADVFARGGFDMVLGNPPWQRAEQVAPELRRRLSGRFRWWRAGGRGYANRPDLAVAFLERGVELAAPEGVVALLVPSKLATAGYGAAARHALAASTTLLHVADLTGRRDAAFDATVYPLALVLRKSPPPPDHRVRVTLGDGAGAVRQDRLAGGGPWVLVRSPIRTVIDALGKAFPPLEALVTCHLGLKTGANRIFLDPPADLESHIVRVLLRGRDIRPFQALGSRRLLFPHDVEGRVLATLPPRTWRYLAPRLSELRARADYRGGPEWGLFRVGPAVAPHRVVWADLARTLGAAALSAPADSHLVPLNSCYVAPLDSEAAAAALAAWLNSSWVRALARAAAVPAASGFVRFTAATVGRLPLPPAALFDTGLAALATAGRRGRPVQEPLDELVARHLALSERSRATLLRFLGECATDRR